MKLEKTYELANHLGNVLTVVSDREIAVVNTGATTIDHFTSEILTANDYYSFGSPMPGRKYSSSTGYRYGFNGKEKDPEGLGGGGATYDYGFRIYNPSLGKFLSVDPLTKSYPWYTPYQFAGNKPTKFVDLDGAEEDERSTLSSMNFMTAELKVATLSKVFNLRMTSVHGSNFISIPPMVVSENKRTNAYYSNGVIYVNPDMQFDNFEDQISTLYHEYKHYLNECDALFNCSNSEGKIISYNTGEVHSIVPTDEQIEQGMKEFDEVFAPSQEGTQAEKNEEKNNYKIMISQPIEEEFIYSPSNLALDEISSYKAQLQGESDGLYKLTETMKKTINDRIKTYTDIYNQRVDYENRNNLNSDGSSKPTTAQ